MDCAVVVQKLKPMKSSIWYLQELTVCFELVEKKLKWQQLSI